MWTHTLLASSEKRLALGEHNDLVEIPDEMLFGEPVKATGHQPYFNEILGSSWSGVPLL